MKWRLEGQMECAFSFVVRDGPTGPLTMKENTNAQNYPTNPLAAASQPSIARLRVSPQ